MSSFTNDLIIDDDDHKEIYHKDLKCEDCNQFGTYKREDIEDDNAICFDCCIKQEFFDKIACAKCKGVIFSTDDNKVRISNCRCKKVKKQKEKPIAECMWVRVRDYQ